MVKQSKRCKVCGKGIQVKNKSGLCSHHYHMKYDKKIRKIRQRNFLCIMCGKKVEPTVIYPAGKTIPPIIKYHIRCYKCEKRGRDNLKKYNLKKKVDNDYNKEVKNLNKIKSNIDQVKKSCAKRNKKMRDLRKENNYCVQCGKKVEPTVIYPAGKTIPPIIKYHIRCYPCKKKQKEWHKKYILNKQKKELLLH